MDAKPIRRARRGAPVNLRLGRDGAKGPYKPVPGGLPAPVAIPPRHPPPFASAGTTTALASIAGLFPHGERPVVVVRIQVPFDL